MKTIIILSLISSTLFAEIIKTNIKRAESKDQIRVNGYISDVDKFFDHDVIEIKQRDGSKIKAKAEKKFDYKENDIVSGTCVNFDNYRYERCSLYKR